MALHALHDHMQSNDSELGPFVLAAVRKAAALGRPFTEDEVLSDAWAQGWEITASMIRYFTLAHEATATTPRYWVFNA